MKKGTAVKRTLIAAGIGLAFALLFLLARGTFQGGDQTQALKDLSDAFMIPGAMMLCVGALLYVSGNGVFDMLNYGVAKVLLLIRSEKHRAAFPKTYYDYMQAKADKRPSGYAYLLWTGLAFLLVALAFAASFI